MNDQASILRQLVQDRQEADLAGDHAPKLLTIASGKGGVGTTTIALNVAAALSANGFRTVLVDADFRGGDVQQLCQLQSLYSVADVLAGRRSVHEVLASGPGGLQILPGIWALGEPADCSEAAQQRLLKELRGLGEHVDYVVIDAGAGLNRTARLFWQAADQVLLVTTPDPVAVMDSYAAIKVLLGGKYNVRVETIVNKSPDAETASDVQQRLAQACRRFLARELDTAGWVPLAVHDLAGDGHGTPAVQAAPHTPFATAIRQAALHLAAVETMAA